MPYGLDSRYFEGLNPEGLCVKAQDFVEYDRKELQNVFEVLGAVCGMPANLGYEFIDINRYIAFKSWLAYFKARDIKVVYIFATRPLPIVSEDGNCISAFEVRIAPENIEELTDMQRESIPFVLCQATQLVCNLSPARTLEMRMPCIRSIKNLRVEDFNYVTRVPKLKVQI